MNLKELFTKENVGGFDLFLRATLGTIALIALALDYGEGYVKWILALVAFIGLWSGITRHCTPYVLLGVSTKE